MKRKGVKVDAFALLEQGALFCCYFVDVTEDVGTTLMGIVIDSCSEVFICKVGARLLRYLYVIESDYYRARKRGESRPRARELERAGDTLRWNAAEPR